MVNCEDCQQEMTTASSCTADVLIMRGERHERERVRRPIGPKGRCGDCGVQRGGVHHLGCDLEDCPRCHRQLISCGCAMIDGDEEDEEATEDLLAVADGVIVYPASMRGRRVPDPPDPARP